MSWQIVTAKSAVAMLAVAVDFVIAVAVGFRAGLPALV